MVFKRGIYFGIVMVIGSISGIISVLENRIKNINCELMLFIFGIAILIGIVQLISSNNYQSSHWKQNILFSKSKGNSCFLIADGAVAQPLTESCNTVLFESKAITSTDALIIRAKLGVDVERQNDSPKLYCS